MSLKGESLIAIQKCLCRRCNRFFRHPCLGKGRYGFDVKCEAVELYYDTRGSYRRVMKVDTYAFGPIPGATGVPCEIGEILKSSLNCREDLSIAWPQDSEEVALLSMRNLDDKEAKLGRLLKHASTNKAETDEKV